MTALDFGKDGWTPARLGNLEGKTYIVTGTTTGIGRETSRILLAKGASVVMLNRSAEGAEQVVQEFHKDFGADVPVSSLNMDLASLASVRAAAEKALAQVERIDALICNAAVAQIARRSVTEDGFESHLGINHYGHFLLMNLLAPKIEESAGRFVVCSSEGYKMGLRTMQFEDMDFVKNYHPNNTYCHSKLAQMLVAYEFNHRAKRAGKKSRAYVCHPGASKTSLIDEKSSGMTRFLVNLLEGTPMFQSAEKGAYPEVLCATESNLDEKEYFGPTGFQNFSGPVKRRTPKPYAQDRAVAARLWTLSEKQTGQAFSVESV